MLHFGEFTLDRKQSRLFRGAEEISIEPKSLELLVLFIEQADETISRQDILDKVWKNTIVTDNAINKMVANLRKVLLDDASNPRYIQTVPKRGYRFICKVSIADEHKTMAVNKIEPKPEDGNSASHIRKNHSRYILLSIVLLAVLIFLWEMSQKNNKNTKTSAHTIALTRAQGAEYSALMHPNADELYYLKRQLTDTESSLYVKNITTAKTAKIDIGDASIYKIVNIKSGSDADITELIYLNKHPEHCGVYQSLISESKKWLSSEKLFACEQKRIKDVDFHDDKRSVFYTAQPQNFQPSQVYKYDLDKKQHSIITQTVPAGWGHHNIDISPDGNKLLIMSTDSDHNTQMLSLDLQSNKITPQMTFDYHVKEAIWDHDSSHILYFSAPPSPQIIRSDPSGKNTEMLISVSEDLSSSLSLFPDGHNVLFSTQQTNYNNRWLLPVKEAKNIDNAIVDDIYPALFHQSEKYLFVSDRTGHWQIYLGGYDSDKAQIVTNFSDSQRIQYLTISGDDEQVLLNVENKVFLISTSELDDQQSITSLAKENLIFTSNAPIIALDWFSQTQAAITVVDYGIPKLMVVNLLNNKVQNLDGEWSYGLYDQQTAGDSYLIEKGSNALFKKHSSTITATPITLPNGFFHAKIDNSILYYGSHHNGIDYLNAVPLQVNEKIQTYPIQGFNSYDVNRRKVILSNLHSREGDVYRTVIN
jgi:DNA-binding winged helix-turn-helix (wHTH) protein/Tol biopolymer transport system component